MSSFAPLDQVAASDNRLSELISVRDLFRYAVSRFNAASLWYGHGTSNAIDEAAFLVLESLRLPVDDINPWLDARLTQDERARILWRIDARISQRLPAPYLVGAAWLQGERFEIDRRVIVPRSFIAELLAEATSGQGSFSLDPDGVTHLLDLCTGSACLAILGAKYFPDALVDAVELSPQALMVAHHNVKLHGLEDQITLYEGDLTNPLPKGRRYDLIIANPPYVDAEGMEHLPPEFEHEPHMALAAGEEGLEIVNRIIRAAPALLKPEGGLLVELGRCRPQFEATWPDLEVFWLDTETSHGEVFWLPASNLPRK